MTKTCTKCGEEKAEREFYMQPGRMQRAAACKKCEAARKAAWQKVNAENHRKSCRKWHNSNLEKSRASSLAWYRANIVKARANGARWSKNNPERCRKRTAKWRAANIEKARASALKWGNASTRSMSDGYVKSLLCERNTLSTKEVPDSLARLKRAQIKLLREVKKHDDRERTAT